MSVGVIEYVEGRISSGCLLHSGEVISYVLSEVPFHCCVYYSYELSLRPEMIICV